jgi:hypothetical protein
MLEKTIRAIQFIAKPAVNFATKATAKVAEQAIPRTTEFIKTWQREWDKDASNFKPTIIQPLAKPASSSQDPSDVGICNICTGPYIDGNCQEYKCWK